MQDFKDQLDQGDASEYVHASSGFGGESVETGERIEYMATHTEPHLAHPGSDICAHFTYEHGDRLIGISSHSQDRFLIAQTKAHNLFFRCAVLAIAALQERTMGPGFVTGAVYHWLGGPVGKQCVRHILHQIHPPCTMSLA